MNVVLPSNGLLGLRSVELDMPRFSYLRKLNESAFSDDEAQIRFVEMLLSDKEALHKLTRYDKNYLFLIAMSAVHLNNVEMDVVCTNPKCGHKFVVPYSIADKELIELPRDAKQVYRRDYGDGTVLEYRILSVDDELEIIKYAEETSGDDDREYAMQYERAYVARVLNREVTDAAIEEVESLPIHYWFSAHLFGQMAFHGVDNFVFTKCPKCGTEFTVVVPFTKSALSFNSSTIVHRFLKVSKLMDFQSFLDLNMAEFKMMSANIDSGAV